MPVDYDALAKQHGAVSSTVDYDALAQQHGATSSTAEQPSMWDAAKSGVSDFIKGSGMWDAAKSGVSDFIKGSGEQLNPVTMLKGARDLAAGLTYHPIDTAKALLANQGKPLDNAIRDFHEGSYATGALHALNYLIPVAGPAIDEMQEDARKGNVAHAAGSAVGFGLANALPGSEAAKTAIAKANGLKIGLSNPNPVEAAAVQEAMSQGRPVSLATATGNPVVKGVQDMMDHSPIGGFVAQKARAAEAASNTQYGNKLANDIHPQSVEPLQAGDAVRGAIQDDIIPKLHAEANKQYDVMHKDLALDPANIENVATRGVGTRNPTDYQDVALPADTRAAKEHIRPIYDQMMRQLDVTKQRGSMGLKAMQNILDGPDVVPAMQLDQDLGSIKAIARGADLPEVKNLSQGLASAAIPALDDAVKGALGNAKRSLKPGSAPPAGASAGPAAVSPAGASAVPTNTATTTATSVPVPGESKSYAGNYAVQELADVQASHNGQSFAPNPQYGLTNTRDYTNPLNQEKILEGGPGKFDPARHITDNPDATNGPPIVDQQGNVLGGNGRRMQMDRVYSGDNPEGAAAYRDLLMKKADQFGVNRSDIAKMKQPLLTRVIDDAEFTQPGKSKQQAVTDLNKTGTAAYTPAERAIADSRSVSSTTLDDIGKRLEAAGPDATKADILKGQSGIDVMENLIKDGVVSPQERAGMVDQAGLTDAGKARIGQLMTARFFKDPAQMDRMPASVLDKIDRAAAPLAKTEAYGDRNLAPHMQQALDITEEAQAKGLKVDDLLAQGGMFGDPRFTPQAQTLARHLEGTSGAKFTAAARQYASDAHYAQGGTTLMGEPPTPGESFEAAFGGGAQPMTAPKAQAPAAQPAAWAAPPPKTVKPVIPSTPAGAEALDALQRGRAATSAKYDAADVLKKLREEPAQLFHQMIYSGDSGVENLRAVAKLVPNEIPKIGRAYLQKQLDLATEDGGFDRAAKLKQDWSNMGDETKKILFKNPLLIKQLDNFFLLAKKSATMANPSGTAMVTSTAAGLGWIVSNPATGIPALIGTGAMSKLMHSPRFVAAMMDGMKIKAGTGVAASMAAARILKAAGDAAKPMPLQQAAQTSDPSQQTAAAPLMASR